MKISFNKKGGILNLALDGRLYTNDAPEPEKFLSKNCDAEEVLTINCEKPEHIFSAVLRVLLATQKKMKDFITLANVCELSMEVFEMNGVADILVIE